MWFLRSVLISIVALLAGVKGDLTLWKTSTWTETAWSTQVMAASTVWNTETYTETAWSTYIPPAVTVSVPYTVTSLIEKDHTDIVTTTVEKDYTTTVTKLIVSVSVAESLATEYSEYTTTLTSVVESITTVVQSGPTITQVCTPTTVEQPTTITVSPTTITAYTTTLTSVVISTITQVCTPVTINQPTTITISPTIVTACTTPSLSGIVFCPSRTINPTYTTSTPLPDDYTWGCPPGTLCKPPQIGCNFEQNPPADTYYCSPDECIPAPPLSSFTPTPIGGGNCGPYQTVSGYFNLNPTLFGLPTGIFTSGGDYAENCSPSAMTLTPVSQISDGQPQAPTPVSTYEATMTPVTSTSTWEYETTMAPVTSTSTWEYEISWAPITSTSTCEYETTRAPVTSNSIWSNWESQEPFPTKAAWLTRRQIGPILPGVCYDICNHCMTVAEGDAKQNALCPEISSAYGPCDNCLARHRTDKSTAATNLLPSLAQFVSWCDVHPVTAALQTTAAPSSVASPPPILQSATTAPSSNTASSTMASQSTSLVSSLSPSSSSSLSSTVVTASRAAGHAVSPPNMFWSSPMGWVLLLFVNALPL